ncbi:MAG: hypothetical protein M0R33_15035 [Methylomonas sp.]|jgi:hypothetical protein|uniref:hypothetical protein n=1 Tax=Methylomonas sp. TaxID=418 RepID=UPI0025EC800E|nr:hypothetical protein [Methylomonas sp.]MCK9607755.1 hypothetical protein [Methylomonas sp.]
MYSAAIDRNALSGLFDNQKKLDDLFDSIFDDDNYFISSSPSSQSESTYSAYCPNRSIQSSQSRVTKSLLAVNNQHPYFFLLPIVLEITVIYFAVSNFL